MRSLWLAAALLLGCPKPPPLVEELQASEPAPLQWYERAGRLRFQAPSDWELREERGEQGVAVFAGKSPDNVCFVLLVSVPGGDLLDGEEVLSLAYQKLVTGPKPDDIERGVLINNLEGVRAQILGVMHGEPTRATAFATRWAGSGYLFVVGAKSAKAERYLPLLREMMATLTGV